MLYLSVSIPPKPTNSAISFVKANFYIIFAQNIKVMNKRASPKPSKGVEQTPSPSGRSGEGLYFSS